MPTISKTRLATSDPLSLCDGLDIFPTVGQVNAKKNSVEQSHTIFSKSAKILAWKGSFSVKTITFFGTCGPSFAFGIDLEGSHDSNSFTLEVTNDTLEAGFFMGANLSLPISGRLEESVADHWYTPWKRRWKTKASFSVTPRIDLLGLVIAVLMKALGDANPFKGINSFLPGLIGSWSFIDSKSNQVGRNNGEVTAYPTVSIPVNILPLIPEVGEVDEDLREVGITLATGPSIGIQVPVHLTMNSLKLNEAEFSSLEWRDGRVRGSGTAIDSDVETITLGLKQVPGLDFTLGWFGSVSFWKFFRLSASIDFSILSALGIEINLGTYYYSLDNTVGHTSVETCDDCGLAGAGVEVIFEAPEAESA